MPGHISHCPTTHLRQLVKVSKPGWRGYFLTDQGRHMSLSGTMPRPETGQFVQFSELWRFWKFLFHSSINTISTKRETMQGIFTKWVMTEAALLRWRIIFFYCCQGNIGGFYFIFYFYWRIVALPRCVSFYCTAKWISYTCTYIPSFFNFLSI